MRVNVAEQLKASVGSVRNYEISGILDIIGDDHGSMVEGEICLTRTNRGIWAKGRLNTNVEVTCSRCLSLFSCPLNLNIEEEYLPATDIVSGASLPLPDEPDSFIIDEKHVLDLTEAICQCALLAIPMKLLCRVDCAGLCPDCGHNLNQGFCDCLPQRVGPSWSELSKLADGRKGME